MAIEIHWRTRPGGRTADNRDFAGIGVRAGTAFCILLDGSTRGRDSGRLVRAIARAMVDRFIEGDGMESADDVIAGLRETHRALARTWPQASASYAILLTREDRPALALHAGDCLVGSAEPGRGPAWLSRPDTLANAVAEPSIGDLRTDPARHRVTRSFRAREFMAPTVLELPRPIEPVLATDGFWADLDAAAQADFLNGAAPDPGVEGDDRSCLHVRLGAGSGPPVVRGEDLEASAYVRIASDPRPG